MAENKPKSPGRGKRRARRKAAVTNVNIFALAPAERAPAPEPVHEPVHEPVGRDAVEEPFFSSEALERRSNRLDAIERDLRERAEELERREGEAQERPGPLHAGPFLRAG